MLNKFLFFFFAYISLNAADILLVLQDAGETQALLPVIEHLEKADQDYVILAGGVAAEQLAGRQHVIHFSDLGVSEKIDKTWKRDQKISLESLQRITSAIQPKKVISGVAFELHGQILESFAEQGSKTFAYWDNINASGTDPYFYTAQKVAQITQTLLVPSENFKTYYPFAKCVGQPSFEKWQETLSHLSKPSLPYLHSGKTVVWVGGYGKEYEEAFLLFLEAAKEMNGYNILVSFHPKMGGVFEREKIKDSRIHLLTEISTLEAVALADVVICHQSTVGVQAALAGKPVLYLIPPSQTYTNPVIEKRLVPCLQSKQALLYALENLQPTSKDFFEAMQIPRHSAELIFNEIKTEVVAKLASST